MSTPLVSICCLTYNHAGYIRDALDGFLIQQTDFPIEILIHDDASIDGTEEIIREYERKYPNIIKPLYEQENQWEKGRRGSAVFNFPRAKGKYIALCEGDDYWTDPQKLQKQVEFLEEHEDCSMCFHPVRTVFINQDKEEVITGPKLNENHIFSSNEIIRGIFIRVVSMVIHTRVVEDLPAWVLSAPYGDLPLQLMGASEGNVGYLGGDAMSVYHRGVPGAWSELENGDKESRRKWYKKRFQDHLTIFNLFNENTKFKFSKEINARKKKLTIGFISSCLQFYDKTGKKKLIKNNLLLLLDFRYKSTIGFWIRFVFGERFYNLSKKIKYKAEQIMTWK